MTVTRISTNIDLEFHDPEDEKTSGGHLFGELIMSSAPMQIWTILSGAPVWSASPGTIITSSNGSISISTGNGVVPTTPTDSHP